MHKISPLTNLSNSIFGFNSEYKTIKIQEVGLEHKQTIEANMQQSRNPKFHNTNPFKIFPNIVGKLVQGPTTNYFFDALYLAYTCHGELVLSPSDIWLAILAEFSQYVNDNAEQLRSKIVTHQGKKDLVIQVDDTDKRFRSIYSDSFRWDIITNEFSKLIKENTLGEIQKIVECDFSCSGQIEVVISQSALMYTCEKYFKYKVAFMGCGIEKVHFLGTRADWENLQWKTKSLLKYSVPYNNNNKLEEWIKGLECVIDNFMLTYDGQSNTEFWNSIVQSNNVTGERTKGSGMSHEYYDTQVIDGWILNFFMKLNKRKFHQSVQIYQEEQIKWQIKLLESLEEEERKLYKKENSFKTLFQCFFGFFEKKEKLIELGKSSEIESNKEIIIEEIKGNFGVEFKDTGAFEWKVPVILRFQRTGQIIHIEFVAGFTGVLVQQQNIFRPQVSLGVNESIDNVLNEKWRDHFNI